MKEKLENKLLILKNRNKEKKHERKKDTFVPKKL